MFGVMIFGAVPFAGRGTDWMNAGNEQPWKAVELDDTLWDKQPVSVIPTERD